MPKANQLSHGLMEIADHLTLSYHTCMCSYLYFLLPMYNDLLISYSSIQCHIIGHFGDDRLSNSLAGTSKPNLTATKVQNKDLDNSYK